MEPQRALIHRTAGVARRFPGGSALDNETQRKVIESTRTLNATRVVIAHRLSTVLDADRVIVMEDGKVAQQGPPAQLLADTGGRLHELVRRQMA